MDYPFGRPPEGSDVLWRCEAKRYSYITDADTDHYGVTSPRLELIWFHIRRRTPKGAWIGSQFVLLTARKRFACSTQDEAIKSFIARRKRQIDILETQLKRAKQELALTKQKSSSDDHLDIAPKLF